MSASHLNFLAAAINVGLYVAFRDSSWSFFSIAAAVFSFGVGIGAAIDERSKT